MNTKNVTLWALKEAFKINKWTIILWISVNSLGSLMPAFFLLVTKNIIDGLNSQLSNGKSMTANVVVMVSILGILLMTKSMYDLIPQMLDFILHNKFSVAIQKKTILKMQEIPLRNFDNAEFMNKIGSVGETANQLAYYIANIALFIGSLIGVAGLLFLSFNTVPVFSLMVLVQIAFLIFVSIKSGKKNSDLWLQRREFSRKADYFFILAKLRNKSAEIRLFDLSKLIIQKWEENALKCRNIEVKSENREAKISLMGRLIDLTFSLIIITFSIFLLSKGQITLGVFVMTWQLVNQVSSNVRNMTRYFTGISYYKEVLSKQKEFFEMKFDNPLSMSDAINDRGESNPVEKSSEALNDQIPVIEFKDVSFWYVEGRPVISKLNLKLFPNQIVSLCGINGAGKTTIVKIMLGLYKPNEGKIYFKGRRYEDMTATELNQNIGTMFQEFVPFQFSLRENVGFGYIDRIGNEEEVLEAVQDGGCEGILETAGSLDRNLGRQYDDNAIELSGGQWQRVGMSRACMGHKDILILDEPASKLDPLAEIKQFMRIKELLNGKVGILISHRIGFARLADRIIMLKDGAIVEDGTHDELTKLDGEYSKMFFEQASWYQSTEAGVLK